MASEFDWSTLFLVFLLYVGISLKAHAHIFVIRRPHSPSWRAQTKNYRFPYDVGTGTRHVVVGAAMISISLLHINYHSPHSRCQLYTRTRPHYLSFIVIQVITSWLYPVRSPFMV